MTALAEPRAVAATEHVLQVRDVYKSYGGVLAVHGATFDVARHSVTGLVGPNGAGKSTMINLISGLVTPDRGTILLDGEEIQGRPIHWTSRRGLLRTFQVAREWPKLTVLENLLASVPDRSRETVTKALFARRRLAREEAALREKADAIIDQLTLTRVRDELAGRLSGGQKRLLEFARAAMVEPKVLLLDEPLAGVNPVLTEELGAAIRRLREMGTTVLVIEHNLRFVEKTCDTVVVMALGRVIGEGSMAELRRNPEVVEAYLGAPGEEGAGPVADGSEGGDERGS